MAVKNRARGWVASAEVQHLHGVTARMERLRCRAWLQPLLFSSFDLLTTMERECLEIRCLHAWKGVAPLKQEHRR